MFVHYYKQILIALQIKNACYYQSIFEPKQQMSVIGSKSQKDDMIEMGPDFYEVQRILQKRSTRKGDEYLIKWKNFPNPQDFTWQPMEHLLEVTHLVDQFNEREKKKAKGKPKQKVEENKISLAKKIDENAQNEESQEQDSDKVKKQQRDIEKKRESKKRLKKNIQQQNQQSHSLKKSQNESEIEKKHKRRIKQEKGKPVAVVTNTFTNTYENTPIQNKQWFLRQPFRLGDIYKHRLEEDKICYYVDVETSDGNLACMAELNDKEIEEIDPQKEKDYILSYLLRIRKEQSMITDKENQEFEENWRNG